MPAEDTTRSISLPDARTREIDASDAESDEPRTGLHRRASSVPPALRPSVAGEAPRVGVLIVEDDPDLQWSLARMLTVHGARVVGTSSGEGALAVVERWSADLVLIDESLCSGPSGLEIARRVRQVRPLARVVLMTSGRDGASRAMRPGTPEFATLPRPLERETVASLLDAVLRGMALAAAMSTE